MKIFAASSLALVLSVTAAGAQYYGTNRGSSYGSSGYQYGTGSNSNSHYVRPHIQRDGDYVSGHRQTNPNNTTLDNYGTRGNYNPYSGQFGKRNPY